MNPTDGQDNIDKAHAYARKALDRYCARNGLDPHDSSRETEFERVFFEAIDEWSNRRPFD